MTKLETGVVFAIIAMLGMILAPAVIQASKAGAKAEAAYNDGYTAGEADMDVLAAPEHFGDMWKGGWRDAQTGQNRDFDWEDYR